MGSGTTAVAAALEGRRFAGCDIKHAYVQTARQRLKQFQNGAIKYRPLEQPIYVPSGNEAVARVPAHFKRRNIVTFHD
jgi:adenine-specific DNA-methyltransferase